MLSLLIDVELCCYVVLDLHSFLIENLKEWNGRAALEHGMTVYKKLNIESPYYLPIYCWV